MVHVGARADDVSSTTIKKFVGRKQDLFVG